MLQGFLRVVVLEGVSGGRNGRGDPTRRDFGGPGEGKRGGVNPSPVLLRYKIASKQ